MTSRINLHLNLHENMTKLELEQLVTHYIISILTTGVLTKADTVGEGEFEKWLKILEGKSYLLYHGYFVTRLPSAKEMDWKWDKVRSRGENWFRSSKPWCHLDQTHFGHQSLVRKLSDRLSEMIEEM